MEIEYFIDPEETKSRESSSPGRLLSEADFRQIQEEWIQEMWNFLKEYPYPSRSLSLSLSLHSLPRHLFQAVGLNESLMDREAGREPPRAAQHGTSEVHEGAKLAHYARACTDIVFRCPL